MFGDTVYISSVEASDSETAALRIRNECAEAWSQSVDDIAVLGVLEGSAQVVAWQDSGLQLDPRTSDLRQVITDSSLKDMPSVEAAPRKDFKMSFTPELCDRLTKMEGDHPVEAGFPGFHVVKTKDGIVVL